MWLLTFPFGCMVATYFLFFFFFLKKKDGRWQDVEFEFRSRSLNLAWSVIQPSPFPETSVVIRLDMFSGMSREISSTGEEPQRPAIHRAAARLFFCAICCSFDGLLWSIIPADDTRRNIPGHRDRIMTRVLQPPYILPMITRPRANHSTLRSICMCTSWFPATSESSRNACVRPCAWMPRGHFTSNGTE